MSRCRDVAWTRLIISDEGHPSASLWWLSHSFKPEALLLWDFLPSGRPANWDSSQIITDTKKMYIAFRIGPWGSSYGIRERKTVSCKQQIMKTLSNNYRNESYWSGKVAHKLCASGCCIWLQRWSIQRGRRKGVHLLWPSLPCGWRNDVSVIVMYWKWSRAACWCAHCCRH